MKNDDLQKALPQINEILDGFLDEKITPSEYLSHPERFEIVAIVPKEAQPRVIETSKGDFTVVVNTGHLIVFKMVRKKEDDT